MGKYDVGVKWENLDVVTRKINDHFGDCDLLLHIKGSRKTKTKRLIAPKGETYEFNIDDEGYIFKGGQKAVVRNDDIVGMFKELPEKKKPSNEGQEVYLLDDKKIKGWMGEKKRNKYKNDYYSRVKCGFLDSSEDVETFYKNHISERNEDSTWGRRVFVLEGGGTGKTSLLYKLGELSDKGNMSIIESALEDGLKSDK